MNKLTTRELIDAKSKLKNVIDFATALPEIRVKQLTTLDGNKVSYLFVEDYRFRVDSIVNFGKTYKLSERSTGPTPSPSAWVIELYLVINEHTFFVGTVPAEHEEDAKAILDGFIADVRNQINFDEVKSSDIEYLPIFEEYVKQHKLVLMPDEGTPRFNSDGVIFLWINDRDYYATPYYVRGSIISPVICRRSMSDLIVSSDSSPFYEFK